MRPMDKAPFRVGDELSPERNIVANVHVFQTGPFVNVVHDEHRPSISIRDDESLMARRNEIVRQNPRNATCPRHPCPVLERGERTAHGLSRCISMGATLVWYCLKRHPQESTDQEPDDSTPHGVPQRPHDVFHCSAFFLLRNHAVLQVPLQYTITYAALAKMTKIPNHAATPSPITPAFCVFRGQSPQGNLNH